MKKIHVYRLTVSTGSEEAGTYKQVFRCVIGLQNPANLERIASGIMVTQEGDEVDCENVLTCQVMD